MPPLRILLKTYHKSLAFRHCSLFFFLGDLLKISISFIGNICDSFTLVYQYNLLIKMIAYEKRSIFCIPFVVYDSIRSRAIG